MPTNPAQPLIAEEATCLRRPGRALIGWMPPDRGAMVLAGGQQAGALDASLVAQVEAARAVVAERPAGVDQDRITDDAHPSLEAVTQRLRGQPDTAAFWAEGWTVEVVDLTRVCSLQQSVASQQAEERVRNVDPDDLVSLAQVTLPPVSKAELPAQLDEHRNAWIMTAANPNLRITRHFGGELQPGVIGFGFTAGILPSFLQVARHHDRYVLRDGYHRAFGLLARGITHAPAFVRNFGVGALGTATGLFETDVYLGDRPPFLPDFLDDQVAAQVDVPVVQKMVVVQGLELTPLA